MREKLIELLKKAKAKEQRDFLFGDIDTAMDMPYGEEYYADHLIANGVTIQKWIPVTERLPDEYVSVLVCIPTEHPLPTVKEAYLANGCWSTKMWIFDKREVTHWMPMPEPPNGGADA